MMSTNPQGVGVESAAPERRTSEGAADSIAALPDPEAVPQPGRRRFSAAYKRRILEETDQLREPAQIGTYLRCEGLYSSTLSRWRAQRDRGLLDALAPRRRGGPCRILCAEPLFSANRSPNWIANCALAACHSLGGFFHFAVMFRSAR